MYVEYRLNISSQLVQVPIKHHCMVFNSWLQRSIRTTAITNNLFKDSSTMEGIHNLRRCMSAACQAYRYDRQFAFH